MSYTIKFTNGKTLAVIADQSIDQVSTSVTLVGKNVNNYGEYLNNNLVGLLENFANLIEPLSPVVGQTWFDTSENRLKVYDGAWKAAGGTIVQGYEPLSFTTGDLWVDSEENQLWFFDCTSYFTPRIRKNIRIIKR
jgi:phage-related protein